MPELDGLRALSILCVLAGHLFPLGPSSWRLNAAIAATGMALFFVLSGFLITRLLLERPQPGPFLIRRLFRIVPLAWAAIVVLALIQPLELVDLVANFLFVANLPTTHLVPGGGHFWSLGVEVQFYLGVALLVALLGRRGLYLLPVFCVLVTLGRISSEATINIVTYLRIDEILAGATVALLLGHAGVRARLSSLPALTVPALLVLLVASAHQALPALNYARPYIAALTLATSLSVLPPFLARICRWPAVKYIADVSYALYVFHGMLVITWLGEGSKIVIYAKRPLLLAATFALAHLSTFQFERRMIEIGKRLSTRAQPVGPLAT